MLRTQQLTSAIFPKGQEGPELKLFLRQCRAQIVRLLPLPTDQLAFRGAEVVHFHAPLRLIYQYDIRSDKYMGRFDCWAEVNG